MDDTNKIFKNYPTKYLDENGNRIYETHKLKDNIDEMFDVINEYCKENNIPLDMMDSAEWFIDCLTKYLDESKEED